MRIFFFRKINDLIQNYNGLSNGIFEKLSNGLENFNINSICNRQFILKDRLINQKFIKINGKKI